MASFQTCYVKGEEADATRSNNQNTTGKGQSRARVARIAHVIVSILRISRESRTLNGGNCTGILSCRGGQTTAPY